MIDRVTTRVCAGCVLAACWCGTVAATDPDPSIEVSVETTVEISEPAWWERDALLGELSGARTWLGEHGMTLEIDSVDEGMGNPSGGLEGTSNGRYKGLTDVTFSVDTGAAGWWKGGSVVLLVQNSRGGSLSEECIGDIQAVSNIDAPEFTQFSEYFVEQQVGGSRLKVGKQDANADFVAADGGGDFVNSSFGIIPTVPLPTFPAPAFGLSAFMPLGQRLEVGAGLWDGASEQGSDCLDTAFDGAGGVVSALQIALDTGGDVLLPGRFQVGIWHHTSVEVDAGPTKAGIDGTSSATGLYFVADQEVWRRDEFVLRAFAQGGLGDGDATGIAEYLGAGVVAQGLFAARPDDSMGLAYNRAAIEPLDVATTYETVIEAYYAAQVLPWLVVKPDLQLVMDPAGQGEDAIVFGIRLHSRL